MALPNPESSGELSYEWPGLAIEDLLFRTSLPTAAQCQVQLN
jgi:hypothetical protein